MPATSSTNRIPKRASVAASGRVVRLVLVLSLWHAPIPWVHAHDLDGPQIARLQRLAQHVAEFHGPESARPVQPYEWHAHLVLPWCLTHHHPCQQGDQREPAPDDYFGEVKANSAGAGQGEAIGQPTARAFLAIDSAAGQGIFLPQSVGMGAPSRAVILSGHFFETYGAASIRDLVGIRLC